jgi:ABC-type antimicrobial peptide transport system permease subunit
VWPIEGELVNLASWTLGLSLIVLTIAIHTTGVVMMAFGLERRIRVRVEKYKLDPLRAIPAVIGSIGLVAVILAVLHGLERIPSVPSVCRRLAESSASLESR